MTVKQLIRQLSSHLKSGHFWVTIDDTLSPLQREIPVKKIKTIEAFHFPSIDVISITFRRIHNSFSKRSSGTLDLQGLQKVFFNYSNNNFNIESWMVERRPNRKKNVKSFRVEEHCSPLMPDLEMDSGDFNWFWVTREWRDFLNNVWWSFYMTAFESLGNDWNAFRTPPERPLPSFFI